MHNINFDCEFKSRNSGETSEIYIASNIFNNSIELGLGSLNAVYFRDGVIKCGVAGIASPEKRIPKGVDLIIQAGKNNYKKINAKSFKGKNPTIYNASKIMNIQYNVNSFHDINYFKILNSKFDQKGWWKPVRESVEDFFLPQFNSTLLDRTSELEREFISFINVKHYLNNTKFICEMRHRNIDEMKDFLLSVLLGKFHKNDQLIDIIAFELPSKLIIMDLSSAYDMSILKDILFQSIYVEKPSRKRHSYGKFILGEDIKINLCFQLRIDKNKLCSTLAKIESMAKYN